MAIVNDESNVAGSWITINEWDGSALRALAHKQPKWPEPMVTIFWRALNDVGRFDSFFNRAALTAGGFQPGVRRYSRRLGYATESGAAQVLPQPALNLNNEISFVRFELLQVEQDKTEHPLLVAWSNLRAEHYVADDAGGVLVLQRNISFLQQPLATLITNTSAEKPRLASVVSMLKELADYLNGGTEPLEAMA